jgi:hypothetical protein
MTARAENQAVRVPTRTPEGGLTRQGRLQLVREPLLALHRCLIDAEKQAFERVHGRTSAGSFLEALTRDEAFAWLKPLTHLVLKVDDLVDARELSRAQVEDTLAEITTLLRPQPDSEGFARRYAELLASSPDALLAHGTVQRSLR